LRKHLAAVEAEQRVDAAVVQEAESAHLIAGVRGATAVGRRKAEHANLLVHVAQVRNLEELRLAFESVAAVAAEKARPLHRVAVLGVARRVGDVAAVAVGQGVADAAEVEVAAGELRRGHRGVEIADRVGRVHDLENEIRERLHILVGKRLAAADEPDERGIELVECRFFVERPAVGLATAGDVVAARAIAAPVHGSVVVHAAQALRRHGSFHRPEVRRAEQRLVREGRNHRPGVVERRLVRLPRSHASESKSPKMWQLAHAWSPWLDEKRAS
jgi:hypothetical protein